MEITPIFSVGIGKAYEPGYTALGKKVFEENQLILKNINGCKTNFLHHNMNKHIINENYTNPQDVDKLKEIILS